METEDREIKLQQHRLRMNVMSIINVVLQAIIIGLFAWRGAVSWTIVLTFLGVTVFSALIFRLFIIKRWNLRFKDKSMLLPQLVFAVLAQSTFIILAPRLAIVFLVSVLVFYNYAMMSFSQKQFTASWYLIGTATALALFIGRDRFGYPGTGDIDIVILWLFFFLAILSLTYIGSRFSALREKLSERNALLQAALEKNQELATRDDLTGVYNRRHFMHMLNEEWERAKRDKQMFCVAMFDLDHFKQINDEFGHLIGDAVLKKFCDVVLKHTRGTDRFARYGGEEFALILPITMPIEAALVAVERIRTAVQTYDWDSIAPGLKLTVSSGVTACCEGESVEALLGRADQALYDAKNSGRNQIVCV